MRNVLITGGAGFIGSHTADRLLESGYNVRVLDNLQKPVHLKGKPTYLHSDIEFIEGDVRDRDTMQKALRGVDAVYHLAAYQDYLTDFSTFFHTNSVSTALLYELIVQEGLDVQKIIVASSQFVQGEGLHESSSGNVIAPEFRSREQLSEGLWEIRDEHGEPTKWKLTPETHVSPPNAYAMSKYSQERQAMTFGKRYGIPSVALRYSIVQGPRQSFYNAYSGACRIFSLHYFFNRVPTIYEDGAQVRDFVNIHDVVDANALVLEDARADYEVFCVGGGIPYTIKEFERIVAEEFGCAEKEQKIPGEYRFGDTRHAISDISKLKALGWEPKRSARDSVKEYAEYLRGQEDIDDILAYAEEKMKGMDVVRRVSRQ